MDRLRLLSVVSVVMLVFLVSCGNESGHVSPAVDTVPPNPPLNLQAAWESGTVLVNWGDNAEVDLAGYRIYRSSNDDGPFGLVNSDLLLCPWYYDGNRPAGFTYYRVTAVDEVGNESAYSRIVGVYVHTRGKHRNDSVVTQ
jgi:hypothetical protein